MLTSEIRVDKEALRKFAADMKDSAEAFGRVRRLATPSYAGSVHESDAGSKWRGGVKVTLGVVEHDHPGRTAGELMADRIAGSMNFVISMEEGARALGEIAEAALNSMSGQDTISAIDLDGILTTAKNNPAINRYGIPMDGLGKLLGKGATDV